MMKVDVYWNLHKRLWSIRHKGKVIHHASALRLLNVKWVVQPAGVARVRRERRKNVHAFARGTLPDEFTTQTEWPTHHTGYRVTYDPYRHRSFMGEQITECGDYLEWHPVTASSYVTLQCSHHDEALSGPRKPIVFAGG